MSTITDWGQAFLTAISQAFSKLFGFLPDLIGALLILWIGWIIAGFLGKLVAGVLRKIKFNEATEKAGLNRFIANAGIKQDASGVMGEIVKWFFRIIALVAAFSVLQLPALTAALTGILNFIPNLAIALVIILLGGLLANFVGEFVEGAAGSAGFSNAKLVSNVARYAILYVAIIAALGQIGVAATVINTLFIGTIAALALALGLAFGLGGRDTAAKIVQNAYASAQQNLPKLSDGMKQQAQQTKMQAQQTAPQPGYGQSYPQTQTGYAAQSANVQPQQGYYQQPPQQGGYNQPPQGNYPQPSQGNPAQPQPGYYAQPNDQNGSNRQGQG